MIFDSKNNVKTLIEYKVLTKTQDSSFDPANCIFPPEGGTTPTAIYVHKIKN